MATAKAATRAGDGPRLYTWGAKGSMVCLSLPVPRGSMPYCWRVPSSVRATRGPQMPKATRGRGTTEAPVARRMRADARKRSILKAARKAFSETGDLNGTTIKIIAQHAEISEGVIYRHF